jgi:hypothetical protein
LLSQAAHHAYRRSAALWRLMMVLAVTAALVLNVVSGAYSGIVHAHDHDHAASDHHHDDHAADHDTDSRDAKDIPAKSSFAEGGTGSLDQTHEHPADVVLSLPNLISCAYCDSRAAWSPPRTATAAIHEFGPSERPPRFV